jgi:biopolymer transport protein TolR
MGAGFAKQQSARGRGQRRRSKPMAEINVTPFVDVMLVLLIVFMVAAPMLMVGVPVQLPKTTANSLSTEKDELLTITVQADQKIFILKTETSIDELVAKLEAIAQERESDRIFFRADYSLTYGYVAKVLGKLNNGGFSNISLVNEFGGPTIARTEKDG